MAKIEHNYKSDDISFPDQHIELHDMKKEVEKSFLEYSIKDCFTSFSISRSSMRC